MIPMARGPMSSATKAMLRTRKLTVDEMQQKKNRAAARQTRAYLKALLATKLGRDALYMQEKRHRAAALSRSTVSPNARFFKHGGMRKTASAMTRAGAKKYVQMIQPRRGAPLTSLGKLFHQQHVPKTIRARQRKIATFVSPPRMYG